MLISEEMVKKSIDDSLFIYENSKKIHLRVDQNLYENKEFLNKVLINAFKTSSKYFDENYNENYDKIHFTIYPIFKIVNNEFINEVDYYECWFEIYK